MRAFTKKAYLRAARNTFVFPGMSGREMGMGNGLGEMETGGGRGSVMYNGEEGVGEGDTGRGERLVG